MSDIVKLLPGRSTSSPTVFGSGMMSNVCRFFLEETEKGGSDLFIQNNTLGRGTGKRAYAFYTRMSTLSGDESLALRGLVQHCASHVSIMREWTQLAHGKRPTVLVPRMLLVADSTEQTYQFRKLERWIRMLHQQTTYKGEQKEFRESPFRSIAVMEGTLAVDLRDAAADWDVTVKAYRTHVMELALMHAIDVAIGMGDRLQNRGNNITLNPNTFQPVNIDFDSCLPKPGTLGDEHELNICHFRGDPSDYFQKNLTWTQWKTVWPAIPSRVPYQGNYEESVTAALKLDFAPFITQIELHPNSKVVNHIKAVKALEHLFIQAGAFALRAIRDGIRRNELTLGIETDNCSQARLESYAEGWKFD